MKLDLRSIAHALGGEIVSGGVSFAPPGHKPRDRSGRVLLNPSRPHGIWIECLSPADDPLAVRDDVLDRLGIDRRQPIIAPRPAAPSPRTPDDGNQHRARELWEEARHPRGTIVECYLAGRGLELPADVAGEVIRFHPQCAFGTERAPAMICAMRSVDGDTITGIHRRRLTAEGRKLGKPLMLGTAEGMARAIKLDPDEDVTHGLFVGEGVETCLAARQLGLRPAWALGSAGGIAKLPVLAGVECLTLLAEHDGANAAAIDECAKRWHAAGREVGIVDPPLGLKDINDALLGRAAG